MVVHRYSIFEEKITNEYDVNSVLIAAETFALAQLILPAFLNFYFEEKFGEFSNALYGEYLAQAFANKISYFKQNEPEDE